MKERKRYLVLYSETSTGLLSFPFPLTSPVDPLEISHIGWRTLETISHILIFNYSI